MRGASQRAAVSSTLSSARSAALVSALLSALLAGALLVGCATRVRVDFDEAQDFSRYRTWDWGTRASHVAGDDPAAERQLDALGARLVGEALRERGLVRRARTADLIVAYVLRVRPVVVAVHETPAEDLLASHHASPSYAVQATQRRTELHHEAWLSIAVADRRQARVVWRGELRTRQKGDFTPHLREAVSRLLARLPAAERGEESGP